MLDPAYTTLGACVGEHSRVRLGVRVRVGVSLHAWVSIVPSSTHRAAASEAKGGSLACTRLHPSLHTVTGEHKALGHAGPQPSRHTVSA